jgi:cytochrome c553
MIKKQVPAISAAVALVALVAVPVQAADELETSLEVCSTCHGQNGQPIDASMPIIWGQQTSYLVKQIHDYKSKDRENQIMAAFVTPIKQADIRKAAAYFAAKPWPAHPANVSAPAAPEGTAVCRICHQPNFEGGLPAPRLAGQNYDYLLTAMNSFADETRSNSVDMMKLMKALTPAQREQIARYLSAL